MFKSTFLACIFWTTCPVLLHSAAAMIAPEDDLARRIEQAQRDLREAEARVARHVQFVDGIRARLNALTQRQNQITIEIARLPRMLEDLQQRLPGLEQAAAEAEQAVAQRRATEAAAAERAGDVAAALAAIEQALAARVDEVTQIQANTSEAVAARTREADAEQALQDATAAAEAKLSADARFTALATEADRLRVEVTRLREQLGVDPRELSTKSQAWMSAESEAGAYKAKHVAADEGVQSAKAALAAAVAARKQQEKDQAAAVEQDEKVAAIRRDRDQAASAAAQASALARRSASETASAEASLDALRAEAGQARSAISNIDSHRQALQQEQRIADDQARVLAAELQRAEYAYLQAERDRQRAAAHLRQLLQQRGC